MMREARPYMMMRACCLLLEGHILAVQPTAVPSVGQSGPSSLEKGHSAQNAKKYRVTILFGKNLLLTYIWGPHFGAFIKAM